MWSKNGEYYKYLIISDHRSYDKLIHVFDKNNFNHITSFGYQGEGPSEITVLGHLEFNEKKREIYVADHGKHCILSYNLYIPDQSVPLIPDQTVPVFRTKQNHYF